MSPAFLLLALVLTILVFVLMAFLIQHAADKAEVSETRNFSDFLMPDVEIEARYKTLKPEPPKQAQAQPDIPQLEFQSSMVAMEQVVINDLNIDFDKGMNFSALSGEGEYLPIVKVQPVYPRRALQRGISGYVLLEFTVTKNGSVKDIVVIEEYPSSIFRKAAIKAAEKFKYKPRVVDGEALEAHGVRNKIVFEMQQ